MAVKIGVPFLVFADADGKPLEDGYIYIGVAGLNPIINPQQIYWDSSLTIPAANIRTSGGYPVYNGSPGNLYTATTPYSIAVYNKLNQLVFSNLSCEGEGGGGGGTTGAITSVATIADMQAISSPTANYTANVLGYHEAGDGGGGIFYWDSTKTKAAHDGGIVIDPTMVYPTDWTNEVDKNAWYNTTNVGVGCWVRSFENKENINVKWFGATGDSTNAGIGSDDTKAIQRTFNYCSGLVVLDPPAHTVFVPAGRYKVTNLTATKNILSLVGESKNSTMIFSTATGDMLTLSNVGGAGLNNKDLVIKNIAFCLPPVSGSYIDISACGHCLKILNYIRLVIEDVTIWGAGLSGIYMTDCYVLRLSRIYGLRCGVNAASVNDAVIKFDRNATGNSIYIRDCYISNSLGTNITDTRGIYIDAAQSIDISDCTLESCVELIKIGETTTSTRSVRLSGIYCENAVISHIYLLNVAYATLENIYVNPQGVREATVKRAIYAERRNGLTMRNISIYGVPGSGNVDWLSPYEFNVKSSAGSVGTEYVSGNVEMINCAMSDAITVTDGTNRYAVDIYANHLGIKGLDPGLLRINEQMLSSADIFTGWTTVDAIVTKNTGAFYDGGDTYTIAYDPVAGGTQYTYKSDVHAVAIGNTHCFSVFAWGSGRCVLRARVTATGVYEDIAEVYVNTPSVNRVWASTTATKVYDILLCRIFPSTNSSITVAYAQLEHGLLPSNYV